MRFGSGGSKISHMPRALVIHPTITPITGSAHHSPKMLSMKATGMPSRKPKTKPKVTIRLSSRWPKSRKIRTTSEGFSRKWSMTMILGSRIWSMWTPISCVTLPTTLGSWACTRSMTACRTGRGRSRHSRGCSRRMTSSTSCGSSGRNTVTMCSAIFSGSSCW